VEEVVIEDDGEWHTADGKYGSDAWIKANGPEPAPKVSRSPTPVLKRKAVMVLSSDDEDSPSKRPSARASSSRPPSARPPSARPPSVRPPMSRTSTNGRAEGIIDLTLSDDDEPPARAGPSRNAINSPPLPSIRLRVPNPESRNMSPLRTDSWPDRDALNYQLESILDRSYSDDEW
jgi:E3 SUMO-protein ligase PIAS1